ncbi:MULTISPECIES: RDD family protein [unclassified Leifsonia]|uniref:RDD family protein n=1 Tax=unclassified Leifsonia TaxID=2663824 RepID=UPI0006FA0B31|nr:MULTISPECIES: RDD family protein [unclassified Leifsonia]KQX06431.1 hypothetical protein ASC59_00685 [Leifsonia sp. Root1293]KRA10714.1 hypothetical protein ASD61_00685 [Leifsonia sp. Root60]
MADPVVQRTASSGPDDSGLVTGEAVALDVRPASVILRGAGTAIDALLYVGLLLGVAWLVVEYGSAGLDQAALRALGIVGLVLFLLVLPMVVEIATRGRSLGRLAIGARVVRDDGGAIALRHSFVRALMGVIEIYLTFGAIAAMTGLLNERSKRLGDLLAGTHSQIERVPRYVPPRQGMPPMLTQWAQVADVARLPDPLSRRIAQFLSQVDALVPATRARTAEQLAREASVHVSPLPEVAAETFLWGVATLRREREATALRLEQERLAALEPVLAGLPHGFPER